MDAAAVIEWLNAQGVPVTITKLYDESTDPNDLLGRPGGYTSKAAFADARVPSDKYGSDVDDSDRGGSIEVFATEARAVAGAREVQTKLKEFGLGTEYDFVVGPRCGHGDTDAGKELPEGTWRRTAAPGLIPSWGSGWAAATQRRMRSAPRRGAATGTPTLTLVRSAVVTPGAGGRRYAPGCGDLPLRSR